MVFLMLYSIYKILHSNVTIQHPDKDAPVSMQLTITNAAISQMAVK